MAAMAVGRRILLSLLLLLLAGTLPRRSATANSTSLSVFLPSDDYSPQQVHVSLVGADQMRISWLTEAKDAPSAVTYGTSPAAPNSSAAGTSATYRYLLYRSAIIHHALLGPLRPDTVYYYRCGGDSSRQLSFKTPPASFPVRFAVAGDLGQTLWTQSTLRHVKDSGHDVLLLPGDLSYADNVQSLWDSFGRLVEPLASRRPWMVTQGNHEVERIPILHSKPFTAYNARWRMPYEESRSGSNLYYSFEVAGVHVIMLGSYADFEPGSDQYAWLEGDLRRVDRRRTPWVFVLVHAPWYSTNTAHQGEEESVGMRAAMEGLLYEAHVDIVFAGHVHAYERFVRVYEGKANECGPVYITIGDGGNREGLARRFMMEWNLTAFRQASFGHGRLDVINQTHALWTWHRNQDHVAVQGDTAWFTSHASNSTCM